MSLDEESLALGLPRRFRHAQALVVDTFEDAEAAGITSETVVSVMLCEALSRMVAVGGKGWTAAMLVRLADDIALGHSSDGLLQ